MGEEEGVGEVKVWVATTAVKFVATREGQGHMAVHIFCERWEE